MRAILLSITLIINSLSIVYADSTVTITCPIANTVTFLNGRATGKATITNSFGYFLMAGDSASAKALSFTGDIYEQGMLACAYQGDKDQFAIMNYYVSGNVWNCHFLGANPTRCQNSSVTQCQLVCSD